MNQATVARLKCIDPRLLTQRRREFIRSVAYGEDERHIFEAQRLALEADLKARRKHGKCICEDEASDNLFESQDILQNQVEVTQNLSHSVSKQFFRVASARKPRRPNKYYQPTKGLDRKSVHVPAAHKYSGQTCAPSLFTEPSVIEKIGHRLRWSNYNWDPTHSWTDSLLFVLVLATCRLIGRKERDVDIFLIDTDKAMGTKVTTKEAKVSLASIEVRHDGTKEIEEHGINPTGSASFYHAEDLLRTLNVLRWEGWKARAMLTLGADWYTGEWLGHGLVLTPQGSREGSVKKLIRSGLWDLLPFLKAEEQEDMRSLYHRCVRFRSKAFNMYKEPRGFTIDTLRLANKLACCFLAEDEQFKESEDESEGSGSEDESNTGSEQLPQQIAPLHLLLCFLGMEKRPKQDPEFMAWIKRHYTADDLKACEYHRMTRVANNLPEVTQTVQLARDAAAALGLPDGHIPPTRVWVSDIDFNFDGHWRHRAYKKIKIRRAKDRVAPLNRGTKRKYAQQDQDTGTPIANQRQDSVLGNDATAVVESRDEEEPQSKRQKLLVGSEGGHETRDTGDNIQEPESQ